MSDQAWVGVAAIVFAILGGGIGWAIYIAWMASRMDTNISGLRTDVTAHKVGADAEHQRIWKSVEELSRVSQLHETRLVRIEAHHEHKQHE